MVRVTISPASRLIYQQGGGHQRSKEKEENNATHVNIALIEAGANLWTLCVEGDSHRAAWENLKGLPGVVNDGLVVLEALKRKKRSFSLTIQPRQQKKMCGFSIQLPLNNDGIISINAFIRS